MDLVPAPSGKTPVKSPVVEVEAVEAVDVAEQVEAETVALQEASSEFETDSDDSEDWDTLSHGGDTIQFLRDEQLRDGLGMVLCLISYIAPFTPVFPAIDHPATTCLANMMAHCSSRCLYPGRGRRLSATPS
jgi:hypothetical protein